MRRPLAAGAAVGAALALAVLARSGVIARGGSAPGSSASVLAAVVGSAAESSNKLTARVKLDSSARMVLTATVSVSLRNAASSDAPYDVAVEYAPKNAKKSERLKPLWSAAVTLDSDDDSYSASLDLFRLRPNTEYEFRVWLSEDGADATLAASVSATTPRTGHPRFDEKALASISGGVPEWELLTMAYDMTTLNQDSQNFVGIVAVDQAGWVVWYYPADSSPGAGGHMGIPAVWDFLPASEGYSVVLLETAYSKDYEDGGDYWTANSMLAQVSVYGELEHQHIQACTGPPMAYNQLSHELRVDDTGGSLRVLTTAIKMGFYAAVELLVKKGRHEDARWKEDRFMGVEIVAWRPDDGTMEKLCATAFASRGGSGTKLRPSLSLASLSLSSLSGTTCSTSPRPTTRRGRPRRRRGRRARCSSARARSRSTGSTTTTSRPSRSARRATCSS
jgi:hypothetical protein